MSSKTPIAVDDYRPRALPTSFQCPSAPPGGTGLGLARQLLSSMAQEPAHSPNGTVPKAPAQPVDIR
jgi:hypothetical protein